MKKNPTKENVANELHSSTEFFSTSILNDLVMKNDKNQENDDVIDWT